MGITATWFYKISAELNIPSYCILTRYIVYYQPLMNVSKIQICIEKSVSITFQLKKYYLKKKCHTFLCYWGKCKTGTLNTILYKIFLGEGKFHNLMKIFKQIPLKELNFLIYRNLRDHQSFFYLQLIHISFFKF